MTHYQHTDTRSPLVRLLAYMRNERGQLLLATLFSILNKVFDLAPPILIGVHRFGTVFSSFPGRRAGQTNRLPVAVLM